MGVLDTIKELGIINVQDVKNTYENHYVQYLDYVYLKPGIEFGDNPQTGIDVEQLKGEGLLSDEATYSSTSNFSRLGEEGGIASAQMSTMSLVLNKVIVDFKDQKIELDQNLDTQIAVTEHLLKEIVFTIKDLAEKNMQESGETRDFTQTDEPLNLIARKLLSKSLSSASLIVTRGRRGPGNFIIARKELIDLLSSLNQNTASYLYQFSPSDNNFAGLKKFVCDDLGDTVLIGRLGNNDEPGIRLISNEESLEKNIYFNETDIAGINIRYALGSFSDNDKRQYASFQFILKK
jgi:Rieske Fe-S protein